ncbi:lipopolysaccharide biosynthesis protein [Atopobacter phocae]|uniref:lipopolysaccharide biosynthesis protein n=1 Tax=Atopobacter phocae TaxID=136492 RepID=UPI00047278C6|nr:hypothetical protein [Atopobacter phocae]
MNNKGQIFLKHFSYNTLSTLVAMLIQVLTILVVAKQIETETFGYWQLYIFYASYIGLFHFGWCDGLYLNFGGFKLKDLPRKWIKNNFIKYTIVETSLSFFFFASSFFYLEGPLKLVGISYAITLFLTNIRNYLFSMMQATNQMDLFAQTNLIDRLVYLVFIIGLLTTHHTQLIWLLSVDMIARFISLMYAIYQTRQKLSRISEVVNETVAPQGRVILKSGLQLLFSNLAGGLLIGIVRLMIKSGYNIETFGIVSLVISVSNLVIFFINGVSVVVFPFLKTLKTSDLADIYVPLKRIFTLLTALLLVGYFPLYGIIYIWLPNYRIALPILNVLYPLFLFEGQLSLLATSYLKAYREEKGLFMVNTAMLFVVSLVSYVSVFFFHSLSLTFGTLLMVYMLRLWLCEYLLKNHLTTNPFRVNGWQTMMLMVYLLMSVVPNKWLGLLGYIFLLGLSLPYLKREMQQTWQRLKEVSHEAV